MKSLRIEENKDIAPYGAFKTKATARYFFTVSGRDELEELANSVAFAKESGLPVLFLGSGTNCLFAFDAFPGLVVKNAIRGMEFDQTWNTVTVGSGESISLVSSELARTYGNASFIPWVWLPGTVGWAVAWNAGCFGLEVSEAILHADAFCLETSETVRLSPSELGFSYRNSALKAKTGYFLVSATFRTSGFSHAYLGFSPEEMLALRRQKQPHGRTCGSFFKNPAGDSAGRLIDAAGLKGERIGGVRISEMHANFLLADEGADWRDVIALAKMAKDAVREKFGVELEEEARIITN